MAENCRQDAGATNTALPVIGPRLIGVHMDGASAKYAVEFCGPSRFCPVERMSRFSWRALRAATRLHWPA